MKSIRTKIIISFLVVIASLIGLLITIVIINMSSISKYQQINSNIVYEQALKNSIWSMVEDCYNDFKTGDFSNYEKEMANIRGLEKILEPKTQSNKDTYAAYLGVKNSLQAVIDDVAAAKESWEKNEGTVVSSNFFQDAETKFGFVKDNTTGLILAETQNIATVSQNIQKTQSLIAVIISALSVSVTLASLAYAVYFAKKITRPIISLAGTAQEIASGNMEISIAPDLLNHKDETGRLATSFNTMFQKLKANIHALNEEKASVERKVVERTAQLNDEKVRLKASIESLDVGFIMTDANNNVITINRVAKTILSYSLTPQGTTKIDTSMHKWTIDLIHDKLSKSINFKASIDKTLSTGQPIQQKELGYNGRILRLYMAPVLEMGENREIDKLGTVILLEDITEAKILERSKDEFFSIASHELRTPLTAIRGNTSLIQTYYSEILKDKELAEMVNDIHDSSIRLIAIVSDFLDASRLEQGKMQYNFESFPLDKIIESVVYELGNLSKSKRVELKFLDKENFKLHALPEVYGDKNRVKQIVYNLIGNAMNYTEKGAVTINIQALPDYLKVLISDTGRGMTPEAQQLLFHKFQQVGSSLFTRDTTRGTGLGLYISKLIVEQMKGHIKLESSIAGKGSVFSFTIPLAKPSDKPPAPANPTQISVTS